MTWIWIIFWLILLFPITLEFTKYIRDLLKIRKQQKQLKTEIAVSWIKIFNELDTETREIKPEKGKIVTMNKIENTKTLTGLLHTEPKEEDYKEYVDALVGWLKELYANYKFQLLKPNPDDFQSGYALLFQVFGGENPELFENLFKLAIDKGLKDDGINKEFVKQVKEGKLVELGGAIISPEETGSSSILRGDDLQVFIGFETAEYQEKRLEKEAEDKAKQEEYKERQDKQMELQKESYKILTEAASVLKQMTQKQLEDNPDFVEQYDKVQELYR